MRICVFGAGSLGSALGGMLSTEHDVTLIGRRPHVRAIRESGLQLTGDVRRIVRLEAYESLPHSYSPDLLIITTKAYDTENAVSDCRDAIPAQTRVLTLQNGLGNFEILRAWKGTRALGGTTTIGAVLEAPGRVRVSGLGGTTIGADLDPRAAQAIVGAFSSCGIPSIVVEDVVGAIWAKAVVSACINPLTAILRVENGRLLESAIISKLMTDVCRECVAVAEAQGRHMSLRGMVAQARSVAEATAKNKSSMFQDILLGRRTEIDQINGAFWRKGDEGGIETPLNRCLAIMVKALESSMSSQKG